MMLRILKFNLFSTLLLLYVTSCSSTHTIPTYDRGIWGSWKTEDCINTRHQLLKVRSITPAKLRRDSCRVLEGTWIDFYSGEKISLNDHPQIDHVIPLKYAHIIGAYKWSKEKKARFYNDHENLVITSRSMNIEKGAKSFVNWHPIQHDLACEYAYKWITVKQKYGLRFNQQECLNFKALQKTKSCSKPLPKVNSCH